LKTLTFLNDCYSFLLSRISITQLFYVTSLSLKPKVHDLVYTEMLRERNSSLATILTNTYRKHPELFIDGETLFSCEGTTQGDPLAMAMYAIGILPSLISKDNRNKAGVVR